MQQTEPDVPALEQPALLHRAPVLSTELSTQVVDKQQLMKPIMAGVKAVPLWDESHPHGAQRLGVLLSGAGVPPISRRSPLRTFLSVESAVLATGIGAD